MRHGEALIPFILPALFQDASAGDGRRVVLARRRGIRRSLRSGEAILADNPNAKSSERTKVKFPATSKQLVEAGYEYDNDGVCRGCQEPVEWWLTPEGKKMPISVRKAENVLFDSGDYRISHFAVCPEATQFRTKK
jgi:hypothetical protein